MEIFGVKIFGVSVRTLEDSTVLRGDFAMLKFQQRSLQLGKIDVKRRPKRKMM